MSKDSTVRSHSEWSCIFLYCRKLSDNFRYCLAWSALFQDGVEANGETGGDREKESGGQAEERKGECCRTQVMYILYMRTGGGERGRVLQFSGSVSMYTPVYCSWGKLLYLEEIFKKSIKCLVKRILKTCWKLNKKYCANFWKFSEDYSINGCNINHFNLFFFIFCVVLGLLYSIYVYCIFIGIVVSETLPTDIFDCVVIARI